MDQILYSIGLSLDNYSDKLNKRRSIKNPYFIIMFLGSYGILRLKSLFTNDEETLLMYGDVAYIVNLKKVSCVLTIICCLMAIMFQLIYYYNHKKGIQQTFIVVIQAICGSIPANSIGIENEKELSKLRNFSQRIFPIILLQLQNNYLIPIAIGVVLYFCMPLKVM